MKDNIIPQYNNTGDSLEKYIQNTNTYKVRLISENVNKKLYKAR